MRKRCLARYAFSLSMRIRVRGGCFSLCMRKGFVGVPVPTLGCQPIGFCIELVNFDFPTTDSDMALIARYKADVIRYGFRSLDAAHHAFPEQTAGELLALWVV